MNNNNQQLTVVDILSILSFVIGLMNLDENLTQGDKQELMEQVDKASSYTLKLIHEHLVEQDEKIDLILKKLEG